MVNITELGDPATQALSGIGVCIKFAKFVLALTEASSDILIFGKLIERVKKDLDEAFRLHREIAAILDIVAREQKAWIDDAIVDSQAALNDIGIEIEGARIDKWRENHISYRTRFEWVCLNHATFIKKEKTLAACHQSLLGAMNTMRALSTNNPTIMSPTHSASLGPREEVTEDGPMLRSPCARRPHRTQAQPEKLCDPSESLLDISGSNSASIPPLLPEFCFTQSSLQDLWETNGDSHSLTAPADQAF